MIEKVMEPPGRDMSYYGGKHLDTAWPDYTPESMREEMIEYAKDSLGRRLHAMAIQMGL